MALLRKGKNGAWFCSVRVGMGAWFCSVRGLFDLQGEEWACRTYLSRRSEKEGSLGRVM